MTNENKDNPQPHAIIAPGYDYREIASHFKSAYVNTPEMSLLLVENPQGYAIVINRARGIRIGEGYQAHVEIMPNTRTGSGVGLTGDYHDAVTMPELIKIVSEYNGQLSYNIYTPADIKTIKFLTVEQAISQYRNMLGYTKII